MKKSRRITILTVLALGLVIVLWNQSRPGAQAIDHNTTARWQGNSRYSRPSFANPLASAGMELVPAGVRELKRIALEATPVRNPIRILWEHLKYWANIRLFPINIWVKTDDWTESVTYFQAGKYVFLSHGNPWHNSVLKTDVTIDQLEDRLEPFVVDRYTIDPNAPAEAGPPEDSGSVERQ